MVSTSSRLPILPLPHPLILLPASRITIPIPKDLGDALLALIEQSDALPVVAAVPTHPPDANGGTGGPNGSPTQNNSALVNGDAQGLGGQLAEWGTASRILRLVKPPARNPRQSYLVSLHGLTRVRLLAPYPVSISSHVDDNAVSSDGDAAPAGLLAPHPIEYPPTEDVPSPEVVAAFKAAAMRLLDRLAGRDSGISSPTRDQQGRRDGYAKIATLLEQVTDARAAWMADVLVGSIGSGKGDGSAGDFRDKLTLLSLSASTPRLTHATTILTKHASIAEVSHKIKREVDETLGRQQKEFFLRTQLAAIQRELQLLNSGSGTNESKGSGRGPSNRGDRDGMGVGGNANGKSELDDDDPSSGSEDAELAQLKEGIEAMEPGSEERKMGVREWRRLKRIPGGSVENGVLRSYLEWLTSIPWPSSQASSSQLTSATSTKQFLASARATLDADHFGLEKVKKRLIEYLAVVRLKEVYERRKGELEALEQAQQQGQQQTGSDQANGTLVKYEPSQVTVPTPRNAKVKGSTKGPILLFVGPPGTGKTSLGQSIARALGRPFQRISLGGVRDEAEIRGHRRTYVASGPGLIVQAMRKAGRRDFVLLLDEIDKIGQGNFHGDPAAALLEVLDPEQNHSFNDHYINVPIDLSQILFICTSNTLETISAPLLDRCEVVQLSGYTYDEKMHIARRFLLPKQLLANGLDESHVTLTEPALLGIATQYTREAGVRSLERAIGAVVRYKAVEWAEYVDGEEEQAKEKKKLEAVEVGVITPATATAAANAASDANTGRAVLSKAGGYKDGYNAPGYRRVVEEHELEAILGLARWDGDERDREERRGVVYGLVVMGQGEGGILAVETIAVPGSGRLKLTGSLGDVIKESGELALSWVKTHAYDLCMTNTRFEDPLKVPDPIDIHLHLPAGAQRKDGPSAGVAMTCAFVSLMTGACVPPNTAMTGEITLRGRVTPVGGIKEKVLGAHRAQITKVILPWANRKDVEHDVALEIRNEMQFVFVRTVKEALEAAFGKGTLEWRRDPLMLESRL